jgi:hypothetical protein
METYHNPYVQWVCTRMIALPINCNNNSKNSKSRIQAFYMAIKKMRNDGKIRWKRVYREGELKKDTRWWRAWTRKIHRTWNEKVALNRNWDKSE